MAKRAKHTCSELAKLTLSFPSILDFESMGREIMHRKKGGSSLTFDNRFRTFFGVSPKVVENIWNRLDPFRTIEPIHSGVKPMHLLWALLFMKVYAEESIHAGLVGGVDEKTFRKWVWVFVQEISYLEDEVVSRI